MEGVGDTTTSSSSEGNLISAAAFVEGGIQEACDDACSICLEPFCDSDPSTVCKDLDLFFCFVVAFFFIPSIFSLAVD